MPSVVITFLRMMGVDDEDLEKYDEETIRMIAATVIMEHRLGI